MVRAGARIVGDDARDLRLHGRIVAGAGLAGCGVLRTGADTAGRGLSRTSTLHVHRQTDAQRMCLEFLRIEQRSAPARAARS